MWRTLTQKRPISSLTSVQQTSLLMAYWRMLETRRSHTPHAPSPSLIQDEFAPILLDNLASPELLQQFQSSPFLPIGLNFLAIRTRIIDDWLLEKSCTSNSSSNTTTTTSGEFRGRNVYKTLSVGFTKIYNHL